VCSKKAYFFQCVAIGAFAVLMLAANAKLLDAYSAFCDAGFDCATFEWVVAGTCLLMAACGVAIVFYCCEVRACVRVGSPGRPLAWGCVAVQPTDQVGDRRAADDRQHLLLVSARGAGVVFLMPACVRVGSLGKAEYMDKDDEASANASKGAVSVGLFLICLVTSVQVVSEAFNDEKRRVPAFAFAMLRGEPARHARVCACVWRQAHVRAAVPVGAAGEGPARGR